MAEQGLGYGLTSAQLAAQSFRPPGQLSVEGCWAKAILDRINAAEKMFQPGTPDHARGLGAALMLEWPKIKPLLDRMVR